MKSPVLLCAGVALLGMHTTATATSTPCVVDENHRVTYRGLERNGIEVFLGIPYGQDTGGCNRFKPPKRLFHEPQTVIPATTYGPSCPQPLGPWAPPITLGNITEISEDCLNLNVARPRDTRAESRLPVMVYIHGGSFWASDNHDPNTLPDGMILESVRNGLPVIHVAMNYRLGCESPFNTHTGVQLGSSGWRVMLTLNSLRICTVQRPPVRGL